MHSTSLHDLIRSNAEEICRLHARIHETVPSRGRSPADRRIWSDACAEFHARYDVLAFPGGYDTALARIAAGDVDAIEAGLCFLEVRPYFFRSGYMFKDILRKMRRAVLDEPQSARLEVIAEAYGRYRAGRARGRRR